VPSLCSLAARCEGTLPMADEQHVLTFAGLLRQLRADARLTQEELAEAACLSPRSVSDLERGINRTARKDTALLLADALRLTGPVRALFVAAARGRAPAADVLVAGQKPTPNAFVAAATQFLPRDVASFTGRQAELSQLLEGTAGAMFGGVVAIHAIGGMAGVGKTAFAVHAAHLLARKFPDGQFFLPLHAHTRGQRPVDPADALASLLLTAGVAAAHIPPDLEARAARWRGCVAGKKILLLLDDAAGHEQVRPLLPGTTGSLVLVTSRRRLAALEDAAMISLDTLSPDEAAELLARLAARSDLRAGDAGVYEITRLCGYLPLAIGMLASQLRSHPAWTAAQVAADLATTQDRLAVMRAENLSVAAAFDLSYSELTAGQQRLFRRLGLVPGPRIDAYAAAALDGSSFAAARRHLDELYDQHLLTEPAPGRYLLHNLLREHARVLAAADDQSACDAAIGRLLDYYLHTALAAGRRIPTWTAIQGRPPPGSPPTDTPDLATLGQAVAWLETERTNLQAAADYAAATGQHLYAVQIPAAIGDFLRAHGDWDQATAVHRTALAAARQAGDRQGQALALRQLGILAWLSGDFATAAAALAEAVSLYCDARDQPGQAYALSHLGMVQQLTGDYPAALASRQQALELATLSGDQLARAAAFQHLGEMQTAMGDYAAAGASLSQSLALHRGLSHRLGEADALGALGALHLATGDHPAAAAALTQSLGLFRDLGHKPSQVSILNDLGAALQEAGDYAAAANSLRQALDLSLGLGLRLGQAEVLNSMAELFRRTSETEKAYDYHSRALVIAREIGVPLEEARALEGIGTIHLMDDNPGEAATHLQQALDIYRRIGAPPARRVQETLRDCGLAAVKAQPRTAPSSGEFR
jgi:tetratricopeptide (TPR) repeat protein/transcriptional regulator with XRE-family HTH domain